ncbi:MAG: hypothetical protein WC911_02035 [Thermoleophilia bacterium]
MFDDLMTEKIIDLSQNGGILFYLRAGAFHPFMARLFFPHIPCPHCGEYYEDHHRRGVDSKPFMDAHGQRISLLYAFQGTKIVDGKLCTWSWAPEKKACVVDDEQLGYYQDLYWAYKGTEGYLFFEEPIPPTFMELLAKGLKK